MNDVNTWTAGSTGIPAEARVTSIIKVGEAFFAGTDNNGVFISTDSGTIWTAINTGLTDLNISSLAAVDTKLYAVTFKKGVFVLDINDINLSEIDSITWTADSSGLKKIDCLLQVDNLLFGGTDTNGVYLSDDSGQSWVAVNSGISENTRVWSLAFKQ